MLAEMSRWVRQIVMVVMFAAFVDFFIPENNFLKYVKVFLGLLVMMVIMNPLIPLLNNDIAINDIPFFEGLVDSKSISSNADILKENINKLTIDEYKGNVERYIVQQLTERAPYNIRSVKVNIVEDLSSPDFGRVDEIKITLGKDKPDHNAVTNFVQEKISIDRVKIDDALKPSANAVMQREEFKELINYLTDTFLISQEKIYISLED